MHRSLVKTGPWPSLAALALAAVALARCGSSDAPTTPSALGPASPESMFVAAANPINATVTLDASHAVTDTIAPEGGSIQATGADGTTYTLDIPIGALDDTAVITVTPIGTMTGVPLTNGVVAGVQFSPDGLEFQGDATLTIVPGKNVAVGNQTFLGFGGSGSDVHLAMPASHDATISILVQHFSGVAVGDGTAGDRAAILQRNATEARLRLDGALAQYLTEQRQLAILGVDDGTVDNPAALNYFTDYYDQVLTPLIEAAGLDCSHGVEAMQRLLAYDHLRAILGVDPEARDEADLQKVIDLVKNCPYQTAPIVGTMFMRGRICSSAQPFSLTMAPEVVGADYAPITMQFTPASPLNGSVSWSGSSPTASATGNGTYQITALQAARPGLAVTEQICVTDSNGTQCVPNTNLAVALKRISGC